jgi:hypothetical protein
MSRKLLSIGHLNATMVCRLLDTEEIVRASALNPFHKVRAEARRVIGANLSSLGHPLAAALYRAWVRSVTKADWLEELRGQQSRHEPDAEDGGLSPGRLQRFVEALSGNLLAP